MFIGNFSNFYLAHHIFCQCGDRYTRINSGIGGRNQIVG